MHIYAHMRYAHNMDTTCKAEALKGTKDVVDLDRLIEEFTCWQEVRFQSLTDDKRILFVDFSRSGPGEQQASL